MGNWIKKDFLLGIGVGCIISAILVSVFGSGGISDAEVVARASKLGMVKQNLQRNGSAQGNGTPSTRSSDDRQPADPTQSQTPKAAPAPVAGPPVKTSPPQTSTPPQGDTAAGKNGGTTSTITITNSMGSEAVARVLEKKGVIKDQYEFLRVVDSHKAHRRFQTGTFTVPVGGDLEEILAILTGKKR